jgi:formyltetrahydrofolate deformylase
MKQTQLETQPQNQPRFVLSIRCQDEPGLVARFSTFVTQTGGNIEDADFHTDAASQVFCTRLEWTYNYTPSPTPEDLLAGVRAMLASVRDPKWSLRDLIKPLRMSIWVSKQDHCLVDLLHRKKLGDLYCEIPLVISNHPDLKPICEAQNISYVCLPVQPNLKKEVEQQQLELLDRHHIDLVVLGKYMQILSPQILTQCKAEVINIHHSFLPAFAGANPYHRAFERGVKLIGATAHYVTEELDAGPIISQEVSSVSHHDRLEDLIRKGRDVERLALAKAVYLHLQGRVLVVGNKTVVFP